MDVKTCKLENEVPNNTNITRTWVERYVMTKDGKGFKDEVATLYRAHKFRQNAWQRRCV